MWVQIGVGATRRSRLLQGPGRLHVPLAAVGTAGRAFVPVLALALEMADHEIPAVESVLDEGGGNRRHGSARARGRILPGMLAPSSLRASASRSAAMATVQSVLVISRSAAGCCIESEPVISSLSAGFSACIPGMSEESGNEVLQPPVARPAMSRIKKPEPRNGRA